jgi:hypothetical protein
MNIRTAVRVGCGILAVGVCGLGVVWAQKKAHVERPIIEARPEDVSGRCSIQIRGRWRLA